MALQVHLAIDLGAGSGRVMAGVYDGKALAIREVHRFGNEGVQLPGGWRWNIGQLFTDIKKGLARAAETYGADLVSVAVDTWGVDYALLDGRGNLVGQPFMYRDSRTEGMMEEAFRRMPREEIYRRTGIQFMFFNTLYQLLAENRAVLRKSRLLFIPDLLTCWLCGAQVNERTIASTSQMLKAGTAEWDGELLAAMDIPGEVFAPIVEPGTVVGRLKGDVAGEIGSGPLQVVACGSHDTASAVAGVPAQTAQPLFLSSGTWSLIGRELASPLISDETFRVGFSNEQGLNGTTRFLKNVAGMWLLQECMRNWEAQGGAPGYGALVEQARRSEISTLINPDAGEFQKPCDMPAVIRAYAARSGQQEPVSPGEFARVILESLALKYRALVDVLRGWMPDLPDTLHIVGGGSQNALLNQMAADATGLRVMAGPVEATAAGNVLSQLLATGEIGSLEEGRAIICASLESRTFEPAASSMIAEKAGRFAELVSS